MYNRVLNVHPKDDLFFVWLIKLPTTGHAKQRCYGIKACYKTKGDLFSTKLVILVPVINFQKQKRLLTLILHICHYYIILLIDLLYSLSLSWTVSLSGLVIFSRPFNSDFYLSYLENIFSPNCCKDICFRMYYLSRNIY